MVLLEKKNKAGNCLMKITWHLWVIDLRKIKHQSKGSLNSSSYQKIRLKRKGKDIFI